MTDDLCFTPATELAPLIRRKELSPVELIDAVLARIEACEPRINAFATLTAERARDAAQRAEAALTRGDATGFALRPAGHDQGPDRDRRDSHRAGHPFAEGPCADGGRAGDSAAGRGRRHHPRQDHHLGVRLVGREPQPAYRHHLESLGRKATIRAPPPPAPERPPRRATGRCTRARTARGRSACRPTSAASSASSQPTGGCLTGRCRTTTRSPMSGR